MALALLWRFVRTGLAVWALASGVFLLSHHDLITAPHLPPADETTIAAGRNPVSSQRTSQLAVRHRLGLDLPLFYVTHAPAPRGPKVWQWHGAHNQYHYWMTDLLHGRLGTSYRTNEPVGVRLRRALAYTLPLTGTAAILAGWAALALAPRLAARPRWQRPVRMALLGLHALPLFVIALALLLLFANPEVLSWFPAYGLDQPTDSNAGIWSHLITYFQHLALPVLALVLTALPELTLQLDAALRQELRTGYATTARAKGLAERAVIQRHALRNALLPTITQLAQLLPTLVAGAVVVEVVFALPGMGRLLAEAATTHDYPVLVGGVLFVGTTRLLALLLADLLYAWADPRIRWQV